MKSLIVIFIWLLSINLYADEFTKTLEKILEIDPVNQEINQQKQYEKSLYKNSETNLYLPSIDFIHSINKDEPNTSNDVVDYKLSQIQMKYNLFSFGSDYHQYKSADLKYDAFKENLTNNLIVNEKNLSFMLLEYIYQSQNMEIKKEVLDLKKKLFDISKTRFKRGSLSKDDLTKVSIDYANTNSEYLEATQSYLEIKTKVMAYDKNLKMKDFPWTKLFKTKGIQKLIKTETSIEKIPELKKLKLANLAFKHDVKQQYRRHLGQFSINYSRDLLQYENQDDRYGWSTSIVYTLPLFEKYSRKLQVDKSKAQARVSEYLYHYQKELTETKFENNKKSLELSYLNFKNRLETLNASRKLFKSNAAQFRRGRLSVNDLFIEQDRLFRTRVLTNKAIYQLHLSYVEYMHLLGMPITENPKFFK